MKVYLSVCMLVIKHYINVQQYETILLNYDLNFDCVGWIIGSIDLAFAEIKSIILK